MTFIMSRGRSLPILQDRENCIIVGRCADYTLQDHDNILKIYIYAPYEARMRKLRRYIENEAGRCEKKMNF